MINWFSERWWIDTWAERLVPISFAVGFVALMLLALVLWAQGLDATPNAPVAPQRPPIARPHQQERDVPRALQASLDVPGVLLSPRRHPTPAVASPLATPGADATPRVER